MNGCILLQFSYTSSKFSLYIRREQDNAALFRGSIELGTLIESKLIAKQIDDVFTKLIFSKIFSDV